MPRQPAHNSPADDPNDALALFRYGLIAQIEYNPPPAGQLEACLRAIAAQTYQIPGSTRTHVSVTSLRRYRKAYQAGGFDALRPQPRGDAGVPAPLLPRCSAGPLPCGRSNRAVRPRAWWRSCSMTRPSTWTARCASTP